MSINTEEIDGKFVVTTLNAGASVSVGEIGVTNAEGLQVAASTATGLKAVGRIDEVYVDDAGVSHVKNRKGVFGYINSSVDPLTVADRGAVCYIENAQTVSKTGAVVSEAVTQSQAGTVFDVSEDGGIVWVKFV